jgi:DNA ligase D-like protein (predicted 3'-phosphoesterase)
MTRSKFIVVKHDAQKARLHYDLRFIMPNSKLWVSFAVRKGVPTQPGTKVLAVRTHDHTEQEALFIGTIKQGYGAGKLSKFDEGVCIVHKFTPGSITLELKGRKFKGIYYMISTGVMNRKEFKKRSYMLFKSKKTVVESYLKELGTIAKVGLGMATGIPLTGQGRRITPLRCKQLYPNNPGRYQACIASAKPTTESSHVSEKRNEFRFSFLKPGSTSKLDPGGSYENTTLKSDRQEKEFPKKSEFPNLTETYLTYLDEQGMADRIPSGGIAEDTEENQSQRVSSNLSWDKTPRTVGKVYKGAKYD